MDQETPVRLSAVEVRHLATLARLGLSDKEVERLRSQLSDILGSFQVLQEVKTEGVPPTGSPTAVGSVMRVDEPRPSLSVPEVLANAPDRLGDLFRVRVVLEES